ncbi:MAG TPA: type II toxin-antitoxin system HicA family toxin [Pirellulaceae bacterium]|jgi:predicted RNA binding protein YcfA (HicA-like mRNA interferase family)
MSELPAVGGKQAIAAFEKAGFAVVRTAASHHIMKKEGWRFLLSVPVHAGEELGRGTLRSLIRASGLTVEEFCALL